MAYKQWQQCYKISCTSYNNFLTGGGGALFPPHCLAGDVVDEETFMHLCPQADDIWFWAMAVKNNTPIKVVGNNITKLTYVDGTQEQDLWRSNVAQGGNDVQLNSVLKAYPEILDKLKKNEFFEGTKMIKEYKLFNFLPLFKFKQRGGNNVWKVFGAPVWRVRKMSNGSTVKYYLFGLPLMKIKDK